MKNLTLSLIAIIAGFSFVATASAQLVGSVGDDFVDEGTLTVEDSFKEDNSTDVDVDASDFLNDKSTTTDDDIAVEDVLNDKSVTLGDIDADLIGDDDESVAKESTVGGYVIGDDDESFNKNGTISVSDFLNDKSVDESINDSLLNTNAIESTALSANENTVVGTQDLTSVNASTQVLESVDLNVNDILNNNASSGVGIGGASINSFTGIFED